MNLSTHNHKMVNLLNKCGIRRYNNIFRSLVKIRRILLSLLAKLRISDFIIETYYDITLHQLRTFNEIVEHNILLHSDCTDLLVFRKSSKKIQ